ncbi:MAG TPA: zinc ribbon domain-containing protein, partial [Bacillota bacterium]|nr:zinc ribbon domain-containing protein [Bacillota bacterium]
FPTRSTRLSQTCVCGAVRRKMLSERVHRCPSCGLVMDRDLLAAYLASFVEGDLLHADRAAAAWPDAEPHLRAAWGPSQSATPRQDRGTGNGQSGSRAQGVA